MRPFKLFVSLIWSNIVKVATGKPLISRSSRQVRTGWKGGQSRGQSDAMACKDQCFLACNGSLLGEDCVWSTSAVVQSRGLLQDMPKEVEIFQLSDTSENLWSCTGGCPFKGLRQGNNLCMFDFSPPSPPVPLVAACQRSCKSSTRTSTLVHGSRWLIPRASCSMCFIARAC